ncbi:MAG: PSD1 and planctomycete cytochrome C domain-containing protein [Chthoniobacter sp.]|uniref:PSD1 and planctomycete cytochrome C domain-containing protein n=1 Tax=Chthoniobacter sp. TaxID=2510640 RepID=UPI0032A32326
MLRRRLPHYAPILIWLAASALGHAANSGTVDFNRDIQPILSENCYHCHGPDEHARKAKLRLDRKECAYGKNEDGRSIVAPGKPDDSELISRIFSTDKDEVMPTPKSNRKLTDAQRTLLKKWVEQGAPWAEHWAFIAPKKGEVPKPDPALGTVRNVIDAFVLDHLAAEKLQQAPEADKARLLRRVTLDLTGLPPTPQELDAFLADPSPDAYEKNVDRLLASPRYGERMVWEWLDAARYADTNGYQGDPTRAMWYWRDWVIKALNDNKPFDQFTVEQLAGDLLPEPTRDQLIATGFHRNHMINGEGGRIPEESRVDYVMDRVETTGTVWMGLTFNCCRCHDHKFDPIKQREYYQLSAYFNSIEETGGNDAGGYAKPIISLATPEQQAKTDAAKLVETEANKERDQLQKDLLKQQTAWEQSIRSDNAKLAEVEWQTLVPSEASSEKGATLTKQPDGSILVSGTNPDTDDFIIIASTALRGPTAVRLEVLPDDSLASSGPGRAPNGSWVMTEFKMLGEGKPVELVPARADFEQPGWPLANALDGKDDTGWGTWPQVGKTHEAIFEMKTPFRPRSSFDFRQDVLMSFRLQFRSKFKQHTIGKFRLSITNSPTVLLRPVPDDVKAAVAIDAAQRNDPQKKVIADFYLASEPRLIDAKKKADEAKAAREKVEREAPRTMVMHDRAQPRETFILVKGAYDKYADKVGFGTPAVLPPLPADAPENRLALARWLVSPEHPLTARVTVNRYWQMFFGRGMVKTTEDFGVQGEKPTHPELFDWLAREFIDSGWDVKHVMRLIVTSATYRQSSIVPPGMAERDPENKLLARGPRFRIPSWMLRDQALAASGLLVDKLGGPPVKVYQPLNIWEDATFGQIKFTQDHGEALYRRSLYIFWRRIVAPTMFFDVANRQQCTVKAGRTNTPLHALVTMNDVTYVEAARALGERMLKQGGSDDSKRLAYGFRLCTSRLPTEKEAALLAASLARFRQQYSTDEEAAKKLIVAGESKPDPNLPAPELAAHTSLAMLLLNLDETLTKE